MNPNLNATLSALRYLLVVVGGLLAEHGLDHSHAYQYVELAAGSIMIVGPAVWGVWAAVYNWHKASSLGVAAGVNMTLAGKALAEDGTTITELGTPGSTPPKPVTQATATEIIKDFAPDSPPAKT